MSTSRWTPRTSASRRPCRPASGSWPQWRPSTVHHPTTGPATARAGSRTASMSSSGPRCVHGGGGARRSGTVAPPGPGADRRAGVAPPPAQTPAPPSPRVPIHAPGRAPAHALTPAPGLGAAAGLAPLGAAHAPGRGPGPSPTRREGGAVRAPTAPRHPPPQAWAPIQHLQSLTQGWARRTRGTRCW